MSDSPWKKYVGRTEEELFNQLAHGPGIETSQAARMWERAQAVRVAEAVREFRDSAGASSERIERLTGVMLRLTKLLAVLTAVMAVLTAFAAWPQFLRLMHSCP